jgi:hypothetical protein
MFGLVGFRMKEHQLRNSARMVTVLLHHQIPYLTERLALLASPDWASDATGG